MSSFFKKEPDEADKLYSSEYKKELLRLRRAKARKLARERALAEVYKKERRREHLIKVARNISIQLQNRPVTQTKPISQPVKRKKKTRKKTSRPYNPLTIRI